MSGLTRNRVSQSDFLSFQIFLALIGTSFLVSSLERGPSGDFGELGGCRESQEEKEESLREGKRILPFRYAKDRF